MEVIMKQLSVFVENKVGSLAQVTNVLKEEGINIRAISSFDSPSYGILRMIVDDPEKALKVLHDSQFAVKLTEVLAVELKDSPGSINRMLQFLAAGEVSVNYIYSFVMKEGAAPLIVLGVSDMQEAMAILQLANIRVVP